MLLTNRQRRFFEIAKKVARTSKASQFKFGVLIIKNGQIVSLGSNHPGKTHPKSKTRNSLIHAEFNAVINGRQNLYGSDIYIWRSGSSEQQLIATPCKDCMNLIREVGIKKIFHTTGLEDQFNLIEVQ